MDNRRTFNILSLGAGVQSTTVLLMSCRGDLPPIDLAIFADTGWEPRPVYEHLNWLEVEARRYGVPVHRIGGRNIRTDALRSQVRGVKSNDGGRWVSMPYRTVAPDGTVGMIRRQCTSEYKIQPIEKFIRREVLGLQPRQRVPKGVTVRQWHGISHDELRRVRASSDHWRDFVYPLVGIPTDMLPKPYTRSDCLRWLSDNYPDGEIPRSACVGCPYRSNDEWRWLRDNSPADFRNAIEFDRAIRKCGGMRGDVFVHRDCIPLGEVDLSTAEDMGQTNLFDREECTGMCGI